MFWIVFFAVFAAMWAICSIIVFSAMMKRCFFSTDLGYVSLKFRVGLIFIGTAFAPVTLGIVLAES